MVAKVLVEQVFCRFGVPISLLSDWETEVDSSIMKHVCQMMGIDKLRTTAYKLSTNQVERLHHAVSAALDKMVGQNQRDWDIHLNFVVSAYCASHHDSTGFLSNVLVLGWESWMPINIIYTTPNDEKVESYDDYVKKTSRTNDQGIP